MGLWCCVMLPNIGRDGARMEKDKDWDKTRLRGPEQRNGLEQRNRTKQRNENGTTEPNEATNETRERNGMEQRNGKGQVEQQQAQTTTTTTAAAISGHTRAREASCLRVVFSTFLFCFSFFTNRRVDDEGEETRMIGTEATLMGTGTIPTDGGDD